ncbi:MAG: DUF2510 domain-containing protein [Ilumatobacteraceae bacterium]
MLEFSAISVSSYEANALVDGLNEATAAGWSVVSIVPTGSNITAYLSREAGSRSEPTVAAPEPAAAPAAQITPSAITPEPATSNSDPVAPTAEQVAPATRIVSAESVATHAATAASAGGAPAGWYADPSGRFDLRYWDGGQWTEHVSRAGQQFTDPPVA